MTCSWFEFQLNEANQHQLKRLMIFHESHLNIREVFIALGSWNWNSHPRIWSSEIESFDNSCHSNVSIALLFWQHIRQYRCGDTPFRTRQTYLNVQITEIWHYIRRQHDDTRFSIRQIELNVSIEICRFQIDRFKFELCWISLKCDEIRKFFFFVERDKKGELSQQGRAPAPTIANQFRFTCSLYLPIYLLIILLTFIYCWCISIYPLI